MLDAWARRLHQVLTGESAPKVIPSAAREPERSATKTSQTFVRRVNRSPLIASRTTFKLALCRRSLFPPLVHTSARVKGFAVR